MIKRLPQILAFTLLALVACNNKNRNDSIELTSTPISEFLNEIFVIRGTQLMNACPEDIFLGDVGLERACIIFPNDEKYAGTHDFTADYLAQIAKTKWYNPGRFKNTILYNDSQDKRPSSERLKCLKMMSVTIWFNGDVVAVNEAIKSGSTAQFSEKILAFSTTGDNCN